MFKSNGGFTLVELIVVIAILAILAGIAVPAYSGYIKKAEDAADLQVLSTVNTAAQGLAIGAGTTVSTISVSAAGAEDSQGEAQRRRDQKEICAAVRIRRCDGLQLDSAV